MPELKFQATPRQWALIGVLGALLVTVLIFNNPSDSAASAGAGLKSAPPATATASNSKLSTSERLRLPEFSAEQVASVNPFARPKIANKPAQPAEAAAGAAQKTIDAQSQRQLERAKALAELRSRKVRFVIGNEHGGAALLGDQPVRVGEIVSGFRVVKIDETGVELVPAE